MLIIRFNDENTKRRALGWLAGRFSFKSWAGDQMLVPAAALSGLAMEGIPFTSEGPATYEQILTSLRNSVAASVQTQPVRSHAISTLGELLKGVTPQNAGGEIDWGPSIGNEIW